MNTVLVLSEPDNWDVFAAIRPEGDVYHKIMVAIKNEASCESVRILGTQPDTANLCSIQPGETICRHFMCTDGKDSWVVKIEIANVIIT